MGKYCLKRSAEVPNAGGYRNLLKVGLPLESDMVNDICICAKGSYEFIALNKKVLREALLEDVKFTKQLLGIEVKDATIKETKSSKTSKKETENK